MFSDVEMIAEQLGMEARGGRGKSAKFSNTEGVLGWLGIPEYVLERRKMALSIFKETTQ